MQKMLKGIKRRSNAIPELRGKIVRVVHGLHIEKGVELDPFKGRCVFQIVRLRPDRESTGLREVRSVNSLGQQRGQKRIVLSLLFKQQREVGV